MAFQSLLKGLEEEAVAQKDRLFLWIPVIFGLGIIFYFLPMREPPYWPAFIVLVISIPGIFIGYYRQFDYVRYFILFCTCVAMSVMSLGFVTAKYSTARDGTNILKKSMRITQVVGTVESVDNLGVKGGSRVVLRDLVIEKVPPEETPQKIRLRFKKDEGLKAGQKISTLAKIDPTSPPVLPGTYDFQRHLFYQGIGGVGFAYKPATIIEENQKSAIQMAFAHMRNTISERVEAQSGVATAGIMTALITGQRGAIADEDNEAMRASGLYHLLSISGTHVSLVAACLFFFSRLFMAAIPWLALHWPIKKIAAVIALSGAGFYTLLAGADVPAQRALMMTGLVLIAIMLDRSPFSLRLIAFAALMVMITAPYSLIGVSFQMSFAAVAGMICFFDHYQPIFTRLRSHAGFIRKALLYMGGLIITSIIAGAMTGLFSLYHFQQFSVYGVLSNMLAVPLTGVVIMPFAILSLILMPLGWEGFALDIMEWGTVWMLAIAHWTAGLKGAVIHVAQWPVSTFICLCVGLTVFLLWAGWRVKILAFSIIAFGLTIAPFAERPTIMVSDGGDLIGVYDNQDVLYLSSARKQKFVAQNWMRLSGKEGQKAHTFKHDDFPFLCDDHGCRSVIEGQKISLAFSNLGVREDCAWADVLISQIPVKKCPSAKTTLDLFDFKYDGAHAVYIGKDNVRVRSVAQERGERPWVR
jgi:competence protein ComEC